MLWQYGLPETIVIRVECQIYGLGILVQFGQGRYWGHVIDNPRHLDQLHFPHSPLRLLPLLLQLILLLHVLLQGVSTVVLAAGADGLVGYPAQEEAGGAGPTVVLVPQDLLKRPLLLRTVITV